MNFGYARVSSCGQELDIQLEHLRAAGCEEIYSEKQSGADDDRYELMRLLVALQPGDVVIVTALDRLTRGGPYKMLHLLEEITSRGSKYRSLTEPWADTTHEFGEVLAAIVGYLARRTREDILRRTAEGRARAVAKGVKMGRPPKMDLNARQEALRRKQAGECISSIARSYDVSSSTIWRL